MTSKDTLVCEYPGSKILYPMSESPIVQTIEELRTNFGSVVRDEIEYIASDMPVLGAVLTTKANIYDKIGGFDPSAYTQGAACLMRVLRNQAAESCIVIPDITITDFGTKEMIEGISSPEEMAESFEAVYQLFVTLEPDLGDALSSLIHSYSLSYRDTLSMKAGIAEAYFMTRLDIEDNGI